VISRLVFFVRWDPAAFFAQGPTRQDLSQWRQIARTGVLTAGKPAKDAPLRLQEQQGDLSEYSIDMMQRIQSKSFALELGRPVRLEIGKALDTDERIPCLLPPRSAGV